MQGGNQHQWDYPVHDDYDAFPLYAEACLANEGTQVSTRWREATQAHIAQVNLLALVTDYFVPTSIVSKVCPKGPPETESTLAPYWESVCVCVFLCICIHSFY